VTRLQANSKKEMRVRFEFYNHILDRDEVETMYADLVDEKEGFYKLDNIPFFVTGFAADDIVKAEKVDDGLPKVIELIEESGNSTINIFFLDKDNDEYSKKILKELNGLGGEYEGMEGVIKGYYSLNIPKDKDYKTIYNFLTKENGKLDFREACIGHKSKE
jgi:hypothetical protein